MRAVKHPIDCPINLSEEVLFIKIETQPIQLLHPTNWFLEKSLIPYVLYF